MKKLFLVLTLATTMVQNFAFSTKHIGDLENPEDSIKHLFEDFLNETITLEEVLNGLNIPPEVVPKIIQGIGNTSITTDRNREKLFNNIENIFQEHDIMFTKELKNQLQELLKLLHEKAGTSRRDQAQVVAGISCLVLVAIIIFYSITILSASMQDDCRSNQFDCVKAICPDASSSYYTDQCSSNQSLWDLCAEIFYNATKESSSAIYNCVEDLPNVTCYNNNYCIRFFPEHRPN